MIDLTDSPSCQTMKLFKQAYHVLLQEPGAPHPPLTARPASPFHVVHSAPDSNTCVPWHGMASSSPGMWEHMTSQQLSTSSVQHQVLCVWPSPNLGCCLHQQEEQEVLVTCPKYLPFDRSECKPLWEPAISGGVGWRTFAGICQGHSKAFSGNGPCAYIPPLPAPILVEHRACSRFRKLGQPVSWVTHSLCRKHWIPIMSQVVCIALDIKKKKKWIIQHACPQNVYALVGNTIMQINNNSYHFLNIHSSQTLWSLRLSKVNELD